MKVLILSDEECAALWDYYVPGRLAEYDLIISCGDLKSEYLMFLVTMARCPVFYVRGNHDAGYAVRPPEGCDCIDGGILEYNGYRFLGLGGSPRYNGGKYQYTQSQMRGQIRRLWWKLHSYPPDVVVTHAPPRHMGDQDDPAHVGFEAFVELMDRYSPGWLVHGHVHMRYGRVERVRQYRDTTLINGCERFVLDLPDREVDPKKKNRLIWRAKPRDQDGNN